MAGNTHNNQKTNAASDNLFDAFNPGNIVSNAQRVLSSAVNVLEEEIAAGILAAKKIEKKIIDVEDIREDPQDLMNRIRRDVHEAVDLLMDSVTALSRQMSAFSQNVNPSPKEKDTGKREPVIPEIKNLKPAVGGETAVLKLLLNNTDSIEPEVIKFQKTDLIGPKATKISARNIVIQPASTILKKGEEQEVLINVKVPQKIIPGRYSALLIDMNDSANKVIIHVDVV